LPCDEQKNIFLSIVIPVFNDEWILSETVGELNEYLIKNRNSIEIIFVNDNSIDTSLEIIKNKFCKNQYEHITIINNKARKGKALCVRDGIMAAKGKYILFMDADLSVPIKEINKILQYIEDDADIIIGVRNEKDKSTIIVRPLYRKLISKIYNIISNLLFFRNKIIDVGCGFKTFKKEIVPFLFSNLYIKSWIFDTEVLFKAFKNNYKIKQISVDWIFKGYSHLNIYKDLPVAFYDLLKLKLFMIKKTNKIDYENWNGGLEFLS